MKQTKALVVLLLAGFVIASCGGAPAAPAGEAPTSVGGAAAAEPTSASGGAKEKVTLSLWTHDKLYVQFFSARAKEWAAKYPQYDFTFDFQQVPDVFTKVLANLAANQPVPDLLGIEQSAFPQFMKDDIIGQKFVDLTEMIGGDRDKFVEGRWALYESSGKIYGVESALSTAAYYYQPEIFEKAGLKVPTTWEDFAVVGAALAKQGIALAPLDSESSGVFDMLYLQRGGQVFDKTGAFVFNSSENRAIALEVLNYIKAGIDQKFFYPAGAADFWGPPLFAAYQEGKVAGAIMPDWYSDSLLKAQAPGMSGKWKLAPMPRWSKGGHTTSTWGGTGFAITKASKHVDLAWDLLRYTYMTKDNQIKRFEEIKYYPTMLEALKDPKVSAVQDTYFGGQAIGQIFAASASDAPVWYQSPVRSDMETELGTQLTNFYAGKTTAESALDAVVATTQKAINEQ